MRDPDPFDEARPLDRRTTPRGKQGRVGATRKSASNDFLVVSRNLPLTNALSHAAINQSLALAIYLSGEDLASIPFWNFDAVMLDASLWPELARLAGSRAAAELGRTPVILIDPLDELQAPLTRFPVKLAERCTGATNASLILEAAIRAAKVEEAARQALLPPELQDDDPASMG